MAAHGRVGHDLLFTTGQTGKLAKKNPVPSRPRTWPQAYHRWLYQDYALLWTEISQATRDSWNALAAGTTRSGFNLFMQDRLTTLPDIAAWWHLDGRGGAAAPDSSLNNNPGVVLGPQSNPFVFDNGYTCNGLADYIAVAHSASLNIGNDDSYTIETIIRIETMAATGFLSKFGLTDPLGIPFYLGVAAANFMIIVRDIAGNQLMLFGPAVSALTTYRLAVVREQTTVRLYVEGFEVRKATLPAMLDCRNSRPIWFGRHMMTSFNITFDETIIWTRALSPANILMHARR